MKKQNHILSIMLVALFASSIIPNLAAMKRKRPDDDQGENDRQKRRCIDDRQQTEVNEFSQIDEALRGILLNLIYEKTVQKPCGNPLFVIFAYLKYFSEVRKKLMLLENRSQEIPNEKKQLVWQAFITRAKEKIRTEAEKFKQEQIDSKDESIHPQLRERVRNECERMCNDLALPQQAIKEIIQNHLPKPQFARRRPSTKPLLTYESPESDSGTDTDSSSEAEEKPETIVHPNLPSPYPPQTRQPIEPTYTRLHLSSNGTVTLTTIEGAPWQPANSENRGTKKRPQKIKQCQTLAQQLPPDTIAHITHFMLCHQEPTQTRVVPRKESTPSKRVKTWLKPAHLAVAIQDVMNLRSVCSHFCNTIDYYHDPILQNIVTYAKESPLQLRNDVIYLYFKIKELLNNQSSDTNSMQVRTSSLGIQNLIYLYSFIEFCKNRAITQLQETGNTQAAEQNRLYYARQSHIVHQLILKKLEQKILIYNSWPAKDYPFNVNTSKYKPLGQSRHSDNDHQNKKRYVSITLSLAVASQNVALVHMILNLVEQEKKERPYVAMGILEDEARSLVLACSSTNEELLTVVTKACQENFFELCKETELILRIQESKNEKFKRNLLQLILQEMNENVATIKKSDLDKLLIFAAQLKNLDLFKKTFDKIDKYVKKIHAYPVIKALFYAVKLDQSTMIDFIIKCKLLSKIKLAAKGGTNTVALCRLLQKTVKQNRLALLKHLEETSSTKKFFTSEMKTCMLLQAARHEHFEIVAHLVKKNPTLFEKTLLQIIPKTKYRRFTGENRAILHCVSPLLQVFLQCAKTQNSNTLQGLMQTSPSLTRYIELLRYARDPKTKIKPAQKQTKKRAKGRSPAKKLEAAATIGDLSTIKSYEKKAAYKNKVIELLLLATQNGHAHIVKYLIEKTDVLSNTKISAASKIYEVELLRKLSLPPVEQAFLHALHQGATTQSREKRDEYVAILRYLVSKSTTLQNAVAFLLTIDN